MDINSDMGEGFGAWDMGNDALLLDYITSTNIACGWHAGDPARMKKLVELATAKKVHIGAHPGLPDLVGFGRREMAISEQDAYNYVLYQAGALQAFVNAAGKTLHHVKPHGALYNQAAKDIKLARGIARAVRDLGGDIILYGLAGSYLIDAAKELNVPVWQEVFADRKYTKEGFLVPRTQAGAVISDESEALEQVMSMSKDGKVVAIDGSEIKIQADTLCIHGDNPHAVEFAKKIKAALS
ncbi:lactam utilization protein LamB [Polynucleobacter wuianus]|uniref:5-oxoprolinase subunit A n=1 Tax=Polynucleobacter wuianus TaxID=1743168 RepID=A0A191UDQ2_9BURK|nr:MULTISPECIES: 5-oxoprolinase subunit PxpA [Polynucleobacter]ANI99020.1 lactam utilization protein LamB [Polynucleobacter wuianus]MBU3552419.1 LamB/YcsF family protein [Polynucleobacter sp. MWH-Post4-6-1]